MADVIIKKGVIEFEGVNGERSKVTVEQADGGSMDDTKLATLATALGLVSDCAVISRSFIVVTTPDPMPAGTGNVDRKGRLVAQEPNRHVHKWEIPGIKASECEMDFKSEIIKPTTAATLVSAVTACTGADLDQRRCPVIQR